jgi:hypothetical protein
VILFGFHPLFLHHKNPTMDTQQEYQEELEKVQDRDFTHNWVSSSAFLFYLSVFCIVAFTLGGCYKLYQHRYKGKAEVAVPESSLYNPKYK